MAVPLTEIFVLTSISNNELVMNLLQNVKFSNFPGIVRSQARSAQKIKFSNFPGIVRSQACSIRGSNCQQIFGRPMCQTIKLSADTCAEQATT